MRACCVSTRTKRRKRPLRASLLSSSNPPAASRSWIRWGTFPIREPVDLGKLRGVFGLLLADEGLALAFDDTAVDGDFGNVVPAGDVVHQVEHQLFEQRPQGARAGALFQRVFRERLQR